jgi:hypothetical protein
MSVLIEREIPCTFCQFPNAVEVWSVVNVKEDPELKDLLLGGELNMGECASCKKVYFAETFLLYHDPEAELLGFVYPYQARIDKDSFEKKTKDDLKPSNPPRRIRPFLTICRKRFLGWMNWPACWKKRKRKIFKRTLSPRLPLTSNFPS